MSYIDLKLKKLDKNNYTQYKLENIISENALIVILGSPGSGKTSILKKYESDHNIHTKLIKVKNFIKLSTHIEESTTVLLLDGLDEYRSIIDDKEFVLSELGNKLNDLTEKRTDLTIVISCREMDWYGEVDANALKEEVNQKASLYSILPLDYTLQKELSILFDIDDKTRFLNKFSENGLLDNPQMFYMLSEIWQLDKSAISSKKILYEKFIINAREHNNSHQQNKIQIEQEEMFKYVGYIAFYYIFCGVEEFNESFIDEIVSVENLYRRELIEGVLKTKLFKENRFIHRTIAEYALAKYIIEYKLVGTLSINKQRIKSLFIKNNKVPTELRGTYAWLCSLSEDKELILLDPYYQAIHGDNSLFNFENKKMIILAVKEYSKQDPYFFEFSQKMELEDFYSIELDDFLMAEYKEALEMKNHYAFFIINILTQSNNVTEKIKTFAKEKIEDNSIEVYYRNDFISLFHLDTEYLLYVLSKIYDSLINDDSDYLKEKILKILYPEYINHIEISKYLQLYKSEVGGYCSYLYETKYKDKFDLVDTIYKTSFNEEKEPYLRLPKNVDGFIEDYFLETLLEYEKSLNSRDIYKIIKHFKKYYKWYTKLEFKSYRYKITAKLKLSDESIQKLANELFELYIDEMIEKENDRYRVYNFNYFFNYKTPNNQSDILFKKLNDTLSRELNIDLFLSALNYLPYDEASNKRIIPKFVKDITEKYHFEEEFENWLNPKKNSWEIESEQRDIERQEKDLETKQKNEDYFKDRSAEDIQSNFNDLNWIANLFYLDNASNDEKYLEDATLIRLKKVLKNSIFKELIDSELLTLESLIKTSPDARRNIDTVYYVSLLLNNDDDISIGNDIFLKYLYINALHHQDISNVEESTFINKLESKNSELVINLLKEYILLLVNEYLIEITDIVNKYICADDNIENLKGIAKSRNSNLSDIKNELLSGFVHVYGFDLQISDLLLLSKVDKNVANNNMIEALIVFNEDRREDFTINMSIAFYDQIKDNRREVHERFKNFESQLKIKIISYMMKAFNNSESIERVNGLQSSKNMCADFLTSHSLILFNLNELKELVVFHSGKNDIWKYKILNRINELEHHESDYLHGILSISEIKSFIFNNEIVSKEDFFEDIYLKIKKLKQEIEDNRLNEKLIFYNESDINKPKIEDRCRDIIVQKLKDKYDVTLDLTKELHEANNRVDINIRYKKELYYEVQVECKRDDNKQLYSAIQDQLIDKYFSSGVEYGIYLIFYFGTLKDKELMLDKVFTSLTQEYSNNIKIVCIDLRIEA
jgi:hypothetical protein